LTRNVERRGSISPSVPNEAWLEEPGSLGWPGVEEIPALRSAGDVNN
jgi:hypothetical protein